MHQSIPAIPIRDAFKEAIVYSGGSTSHKRNQTNYASQLADYWEAEPLQVVSINQARNSHVRHYVAHRSDLGHTPNTIRQATNPIRLLNNWIIDEVAPDFRPLEVGRFLRDLAPRTAPDHVYLTLEQLVTCLQIAADNDKPAALLGFAACGLAGLRIESELARTTPARLRGDELTITGRKGEVKNDSSRRVIPVCGLVKQLLTEHFEHFGGGGRWGGNGCMYAYKTFWTQMRWVLDHAAELTGNERYRICDPHHAGRTTFENIMKSLKVDVALLDGYTGRSPQWVRQRHYANNVARPTMIPEINAEKITELRASIIAPLEEKLKTVSI